MKYHKLIRDKIPEIIKAKGEKVVYHIAGEAEYEAKLLEKLREEVNEFIFDPSMAEMADIYEVLEAMQTFYGFEPDAVFNLQEQKRAERGGFEDRIILDEA